MVSQGPGGMGRSDAEMKRNMSAGGAMLSGEIGERAVVVGGYRMGGHVPCDTSSNDFFIAPLRVALSYCPRSIYSGGYDQFTGICSTGFWPICTNSGGYMLIFLLRLIFGSMI